MYFSRWLLGLALLAALLVASAEVCAQSPAVQPPGQQEPENRSQDSQSPAADAPAPPPPSSAEPAKDPPGGALTMFPHSESSRWWISGQANIILQWHGSFPAKYSGANSLQSHAENATSKLYTLYLGYQLTHTTEVFLDMESAGGHGISDALGVAGFPNLDVVRNPDLSQTPYVARFMLRQVIPLSSDRVAAGRGPLGLATSLPARRIELHFGKFGLVDFFDQNSWGTDSHLQFLNWTVDNSGIYDYAANTRGYTDGIEVEYDDRWWSLRFAEALMPKVANGINLDADLARARAENLETEFRGQLFPHRSGVLRFLSYLNHANMGSYRAAINRFLAGVTPLPDITSTRRQGRRKYGFGLNFEQEVTPEMGVFGRLGWSDGRNESFAYTEVDRALELGGFATGGAWHRRNDRAGVVFALNAVSPDHRQYLALGGKGFLLGDGALSYGQEKIFEGFYTAHVWRGIFTSLDLQRVTNPGYNRDRGPALVPGLRLHVDF